jgi:hypothetical protein
MEGYWDILWRYNIWDQTRLDKNARFLASSYTEEKTESIDDNGSESCKFWILELFG